jgi:peptidoglycan/xylan/chitin deacetylase (PgdA/CDA1 family)
MSTSHLPGELGNEQRSRKINKRLVLVLMLSAMLILFGTVPLISLSSWGKSTNPIRTETYLTTHSVKKVSIHHPTRIPTAIPTQVRVHAPTLNYPLFNGNTRIREIALTFDDGPNPYYTPQVLAILQQCGVKATFFDVGYLVADYPNIVRQEYHQGNIVGNHSWSHPVLTDFSAQGIKSQLTSTTNIIQATIGVRPSFFRPPYGAINNTVLAQARNLHYTTVMWDGSAEDWNLPGVNVIVGKTLYYARNGAILLLHDGGGNRAQTVAALPIIIATLRSRGYRFVTLQQLVDDLVSPSQ